MHSADRISERYHFFRILFSDMQRWRPVLACVISSRRPLFSFSNMTLFSMLVIICADCWRGRGVRLAPLVEPTLFLWSA